MMDRPLRFKLIVFSALILVVDWVLYFRHAGHFFQADSIFFLENRALTLPDYLNEFIALNPSGWYRPLANELFESILYPFAGLHPIPYRIPVYVAFIAVTIAVYVLTLALTSRHLAAALAVFFFTTHTINAYTTYDLAFMPELLYALFYVVAVTAFLRYLKSGSKGPYWFSVGCFVASLMSKESAVTLPATLFVSGLIFGSAFQPFRDRFFHAVRSIAPHMLVLVLYLIASVGYLQPQGFSLPGMFDQSQVLQPGAYVPVLNGGVFKNADLSLTWAFNIPRGFSRQWQNLNPGAVGYLKFFRAFVFALVALVLLRSARAIEGQAILFGSFWFWITLIPALPLVAHFMPYYLFLPVVGLSVTIGAAFIWLYDFGRRFHSGLSVLIGALIVLIFAGTLTATSRGIQDDIRSNRLLGGSSQIASGTLNDLKRLHSTIPTGATLYFADALEPLSWDHAAGGLIKMAYGTDQLSILYQSQGHYVRSDSRNVLVLDVQNGRLTDATGYPNDSADNMRFVDSDRDLHLSTTEISGAGHYMLTISGARNALVRIAYTLNNGAVEMFSARLDGHGSVTFNVSRHSRKGVYRFKAFNMAGTDDWIASDQTLTVR